MVDFELKRIESTPTETIGVLLIDRQAQCFTLEPPKKGNSANISCIPTGQYKIKTYESRKFKRTCIKLYDVFGREYISIHNGNSSRDTMGCILVGERVKKIGGSRELRDSRIILKIITSKLIGDGILTIQEAF